MLPTTEPREPDVTDQPTGPGAGAPAGGERGPEGWRPPPQAPPAQARPSRWDRSQGLQLGRHRYLRSSDDKVVAGVAGGLADMTGIDPLVWRIGFVILAFSGGFGFLVYLALWLLAPQRMPGSYVARPSSPTEGVDWKALFGLGLAGIAVLVLLPFSGDGGLLAGLLLLGLAAWLWSNGQRGTDTAPPTQAPPPSTWPAGDHPAGGTAPTRTATPPAATVASTPDPSPQDADHAGGEQQPWSSTTDAPPSRTEAASRPAPAGDQTASWSSAPPPAATWPTTATAADRGVGGQPYGGGGWGPPPQGAPSAAAPVPPIQPAAPRQRSVLGRLTFAVALLFVGVAAVADEFGIVDVTVGAVASWTIVVLGAGMLVGAWYGRARWLALLAVPVLPVAMVGQAVTGLDVPLNPEDSIDATFTLTAPGDVPEEGFRFGVGELDLDMRDFDGTTDEPIDVRLGAGQVTVFVPDDAAGTVTLRAGVGEVTLEERFSAGISPSLEEIAYGPADADIRIDLDIRVGAGEVLVTSPSEGAITRMDEPFDEMEELDEDAPGIFGDGSPEEDDAPTTDQFEPTDEPEPTGDVEPTEETAPETEGQP